VDGVATLRGDFEIEYTPPVQSHVGGTRLHDAAPIAPERGESVHGTPPASPERAQDAHDTEEPGTPAPQRQAEVEFVTPPSSPTPSAEERDPDVRRYRTMQNIDEVLEQELHLAEGEEPATLTEAQADAAWRAAMEEEMGAIMENHTWELCNLPSGHRPIGLKWVYKLKKNPAGDVVRHKARLVAKGYAQRAGIDFDEVFAPVARLDSVRLLLAVAAHQKWEVHHLDVKFAFLNGELTEEVFVSQPPGFVVRDQEGKVLRLKKALYGLRQAPCAWNAKLDSSLLSLGFSRSRSEHAVYTRGRGKSRLLLGVYVDDLVVTGEDQQEIARFKDQMKNLFKMSDLGMLTYYLGIEVT
jgi:hypothetical protein